MESLEGEDQIAGFVAHFDLGGEADATFTGASVHCEGTKVSAGLCLFMVVFLGA